MVAIGTLLLLIALSLLVTRAATVILTATGMSRSVAQFQARSAFTGTGFTTAESDDVVNHPVRRRVVTTLMLLGNAGFVAAAGTLILGFRGGAVGDAGWRILELVAGLLALVYLSRSRWVDRRLTGVVARFVNKHTDLAERDVSALLPLPEGYAVGEMAVSAGDWVAGRSLADLALRKEGVTVLGLTPASGSYRGALRADTVIEVGDLLVLYGRQRLLDELDRRVAGPEGDAAHWAAAREQAAYGSGEGDGGEDPRG